MGEIPHLATGSTRQNCVSAEEIAPVGQLHDEERDRQCEEPRVEGLVPDIDISQPGRGFVPVNNRRSGGYDQQEDRKDETRDGQEHLANGAAGAFRMPRHMGTTDSISRPAGPIGICHA